MLLLIGAMFVLDDPKGVYNLTLLVVRDLFEVQVSRVVRLQACIAVVLWENYKEFKNIH